MPFPTPPAWTGGRIALSVAISQLLFKFKIPFPRVTFEHVGSWSMPLVARLVLPLIEYKLLTLRMSVMTEF